MKHYARRNRLIGIEGGFGNTCCSGCSACYNVCPKSCITMTADQEGFLYPIISETDCLNCGLCDTVCYVKHPAEIVAPIGVFAGINTNDKIRMKSSSGGVFYMLAEKIIELDGIVFGARYDEDFMVLMDSSDTLEGVKDFMGSKYVQAKNGDVYKQVESFLQAGKIVLFSGVLCQVSALKHFLKKNYDNLITVACMCHSVSSPLLWKKYLNQISKCEKIVNINLRDKSTGWTNYSYSSVFTLNSGRSVKFFRGGEYMQALSANLIQRPSCIECKAKNGRSGADIVLGDCWGVWDYCPDMDDNKGTSLIITYSEKGDALFKSLNVKCKPIKLNGVEHYNGGFSNTSKSHDKRNYFYRSIIHDDNVIEQMRECLLGSKSKLSFAQICNKLYKAIKSKIVHR